MKQLSAVILMAGFFLSARQDHKQIIVIIQHPNAIEIQLPPDLAGNKDSSCAIILNALELICNET